MVEAQVEINATTSSRDAYLMSTAGGTVSSGFSSNSLNMTICPESTSFAIGPLSSSSTSDGVTTSSPTGRQENEYFKELAELLQDTLSRPDSLQGVNRPALMDLIKQLHQQAKDRKENPVQHEDVSSSGPILLASHVGPMILEALDGFFFVMNTDGFIEYVSQNVVKYLKYYQGDLLNKPIYNFVAPADQDLFSRLLPDSMAWQLLGHASNASSTKERRSHKFMCRFLMNVDSTPASTRAGNSSLSTSVYENLQVSAISLPYPESTDAHRDDDFGLSFNVTADSQPCLVCVARRLPEKCNSLGCNYDGCQFTIFCTPDGEIINVDFKDKITKQLLPKDLHRVQIRSLCVSYDVPLLNNHFKEVIERGSHSINQIRLINPAMNNLLLLLQVQSTFCTDNNVINNFGFPCSNYVQLDFTMLRTVDCASSSCAIGIDPKTFASSSSSSSQYPNNNMYSNYNSNSSVYPGLVSSQQHGSASSLSMMSDSNSFDPFNDAYFVDDYSNVGAVVGKSSGVNFNQPAPTLFPQSVISANGKLVATPKYAPSAAFDVNSSSTPATPSSMGSNVAGGGTPARCPSTISEPVSSTGQDDLQRICQMFSISVDDYSGCNPQHQQPSSSNFLEYNPVLSSNEQDYMKSGATPIEQQNMILKGLLREEDQPQHQQHHHQTSCVQPNISSVLLPQATVMQAVAPPAPPSIAAQSTEKPAKATRRGGGAKKASKKATRILEQLLKPEPPTGSWCSSSAPPVLKPELQTVQPYLQETNASHMLAQLLTDDEPAGSPISSSTSVLGKRKHAPPSSSSCCNYDQSSTANVTSPSTLVSSSTAPSLGGPSTSKADSLLVKLLEKPLPQTRTLPTSIASTQFDKMAKENKENPNKPCVSTLIVESLLHKTKPQPSAKQSPSSSTSSMPNNNNSTPPSPRFASGPTMSPASMNHFTQMGHLPNQQQTGMNQSYHSNNVPGQQPSFGGNPFADVSPFMDPRLLEQMQYAGCSQQTPPAFDMANIRHGRFPSVGHAFQDGGAGPQNHQPCTIQNASASMISSSPRFPVTPTPPNVRQQILMQQRKRGKQQQQQQQQQQTNAQTAANCVQAPYSAGPMLPCVQTTSFPFPGYHYSAPSTPTGSSAPNLQPQSFQTAQQHQQQQPVTPVSPSFVTPNAQQQQQQFAVEPRFVQQLPHQHRLPVAPSPSLIQQQQQQTICNVPTSDLVRQELRQSLQSRSTQQQHQQMLSSSSALHVSATTPPFIVNRSMSVQQQASFSGAGNNWQWAERRYSQDYNNANAGTPMDNGRLMQLPAFSNTPPQFVPSFYPSDPQQSHQMAPFVRNGSQPTESQQVEVSNASAFDWWNVDGLENGLDMDDESTQNLLQMLRNS